MLTTLSYGLGFKPVGDSVLLRMIRKYLYSLFAALAVSACGSGGQICVLPPAGDVVYVVDEGWHAEIGMPVGELDKDLAFYRKSFPEARVLMFGYGKRTFFTAPPETVSEYLLGPFPGPAAIQVVGLRVTPVEAYPPGNTVTLTLPPGGSQALSAYIWKELAKDSSGKPFVIAHSSNPEGLFYAAQSEYNLFHTCNTWTAEALHDAGLPISGNTVILSGQGMSRIKDVAASQCARLR